jgi:aryl carrier-like protein
MVYPGSKEAPLTLATFFNIAPYMGFPARMHQISSTESLWANSPMARKSAAGILEAISTTLARELQVQMIPSLCVPLWAMPVSSAANIDRDQLQALALELSADEVDSFSLLPLTKGNPKVSTPREEVMARLWMDVLGLDSVSADDHFISRGGDSLAAMRLVQDAQTAGVKLSVATNFQSPILNAMAAMADFLQLEVDKPLDAEQTIILCLLCPFL